MSSVDFGRTVVTNGTRMLVAFAMALCFNGCAHYPKSKGGNFRIYSVACHGAAGAQQASQLLPRDHGTSRALRII